MLEEHVPGDAIHETQGGTVGGAWESGERAADAALRKLSGIKDNSIPDRTTRQPRSRVPRETVSSGVPEQRGGLTWPTQR